MPPKRKPRTEQSLERQVEALKQQVARLERTVANLRSNSASISLVKSEATTTYHAYVPRDFPGTSADKCGQKLCLD